MKEKATFRIALVEDRTLVRQIYARLVRDELGRPLGAKCTSVADRSVARLLDKQNLRSPTGSDATDAGSNCREVSVKQARFFR